jgi:hypothetical protein
MEDTVTEAVRKPYEAYSYPPPIEEEMGTADLRP